MADVAQPRGGEESGASATHHTIGGGRRAPVASGVHYAWWICRGAAATLGEPQGTVEPLQHCTAEQIVDVPCVHILDVPVLDGPFTVNCMRALTSCGHSHGECRCPGQQQQAENRLRCLIGVTLVVESSCRQG